MMNDTFTAPDGKVACPRSWDNAGLLTDFEIHYEDPDKFVNGICRACHAKLMKTHKGFIAGKVEAPANLNEKRHDQSIEQDHVAYESDGHVEQVTDFNWSLVEGAEADSTPEAREQAAEVLRRVFQWCYAQGGKTPLTVAAAKLGTLVSGLDASMLDGKTLEQMGKELGKTKAALSKTSLAMQDKAGFKLARSRGHESRAAMRKARLGGPDRHHAKQEAAAP